MACSFGLSFLPWTYQQGCAEWFEATAGEVGFEHVVIPAVGGAHAIMGLCLADSPRHFVTEGGWHFPADGPSYKALKHRPPVARWTKNADHLAQVAKQSRRLGLGVVLRVSLRGVEPLLERETQLAQRSAWGEVIPGADACVLNPQVRELLHETISDLKRYEPAVIELADWAPDRPVERREKRPVEWNREARELLDICFCAACRDAARRAGVDPEPAAAFVRARLTQLLSRPPKPGAGEEAGDEETLRTYQRARNEEAVRWLDWLSGTVSPLPVHSLLGFDSIGEAGWPTEGPVILRLSSVREKRWCAEDEPLDGEAVRGIAAGVWQPFAETSAELVRFVAAAAGRGIAYFDFEGLQESPPEAVTWLKQAVRYARRG